MGIPSVGSFFGGEAQEKPLAQEYQSDLYFNGVNGETGGYGLQPMPVQELASLIQGKPYYGTPTEGYQLRGELAQAHPALSALTEQQWALLLKNMSDERKKLMSKLAEDKVQLFVKLINKPKEYKGLLGVELRNVFSALELARYEALADELHKMFELMLEKQTQQLAESLPAGQQQALTEMLQELWQLDEQQDHQGELGLKKNEPFPVKAGVDPADLAQAGWAVIFPAVMDARRKQNIEGALAELFEHRKKQAGEKFYRVLDYRPGETKSKFLQRYRVGDGPADPEEMPFYVLLVGSPEEIPFEFQYQLDVMRAVGRLDFGDDLDAYRQYAHNVVLAETGQVKLPRRMAFFGVSNPGDKATQLSSKSLIQPLWDNLQVAAPPTQDEALQFKWEFARFTAAQATHHQLAQLLGGDPAQTPALLLTASHGMEFPMTNPDQIKYQGALLCQDWPGPSGKLDRKHYFAAEDLAPNANVLGMVIFFFACYGAGTPKLDQFSALSKPKQIAPRNFIAALPQQLLRQGALAVLGHVERAWGYSFVMPTGEVDNQSFVTALRKLLNGERVGMATDAGFNLRYADKSSDLSYALGERAAGSFSVSDADLTQMWMATNDTRGYVVLGDPAVRIPFARP